MNVFKSITVAALFALGLINPAAAEYPERPITFLIGQSPGGGTDVFRRLLTRYMEKQLGVSIAVVNMPGAGGELAFTELAQAAPDGYTIGMLNIPNILTQIVTKSDVNFTLDDFSYLGKVYSGHGSLAVKADSPLKNLADFVDYAKANPGATTVGIGGLGSDDHLVMLRFKKVSGADFTIVPMGDGASARAGVLGGHVTAANLSLVELPQYKDELRGLGAMAEERMDFAPDVPTFKEQGYDVVSSVVRMVAAPKDLPEDIRAKLADAVGKAANDPEFVAEAAKLSSFADYAGPEEAEAYIREQHRILSELWAAEPW